MPIYLFHFHNASGVVLDNEGTDLPSDEAAEIDALIALNQMSADNVRKGVRFHRIDVTDAAGTPLLTASLTLKITRPVE